MTAQYRKWTHRPLGVGDGSHIKGCHIVENGGGWVASQVAADAAPLIAAAPEMLNALRLVTKLLAMMSGSWPNYLPAVDDELKIARAAIAKATKED